MSIYATAFKLFSKAYSFFPYKLLNGYALPPLHIAIDLTYRCNLRCEMCIFLRNEFDKTLKEKKRRELDTEEWKRIIDQFRPYQILSFSGGEVMTRKDLFEILEHAGRRNRYTIVSNGSMITPEVAKRLVDLSPKNDFGKGLLETGISIEQPEESHDEITGIKGSFNKTVGAVEAILQNRMSQGKKFPQVTLRAVIMKENVHNLTRIFEMADRYGVDVCNFSILYTTEKVNRVSPDNPESYLDTTRPVPAIDSADLKEALDGLREMARRSRVSLRFTPESVPHEEILKHYRNELDLDDFRCYSPWFRGLITAYGELMPCSEYVVGSLLETDFFELWNSERFRKFRRTLKKGVFPNCSGCCSLVYHKRPHKKKTPS